VQAPRDDLPPKVALVLGGGAARGFAHVGVLEVLEEAGIPVELVVGTSVGALVGALYADGWDARALERVALALDRDDFFDVSVGRALFGVGIAKGDALAEFLRDHLRHREIAALPLPFAAVATDLDTGERVVLSSGDIATAVRASCAIPGVFEPQRIGGRLLVDGGVVANLPVDVARELGADVVIAVDVSAVAGKAEPDHFMDVIFRAVNILVHQDTLEARRRADVVIVPDVGDVELLDFDAKERVRRAGVAAARAALPEIRAALATPAHGARIRPSPSRSRLPSQIHPPCSRAQVTGAYASGASCESPSTIRPSWPSATIAATRRASGCSARGSR
jgi:NTE family protein